MVLYLGINGQHNTVFISNLWKKKTGHNSLNFRGAMKFAIVVGGLGKGEGVNMMALYEFLKTHKYQGTRKR